MSSPPPTKPPRGVKQGKETSGLLMSVIRTLSGSETNEQREKERAKLEKEYKKSDARLDELVAEHAQDIMEVMKKFSEVVAALAAWGQHCDAASARLSACRSLLQLRRDDLRRLWSLARTHHYALQMLTDIEQVVVSERESREACASGRVLAAACTLRAALDTAAKLTHVHALNTTREHLQVKKTELVDIIVRRISDAVYKDERVPLTRRISARRRTALLLAELTKNDEVTDAYLQDITPEFEASLSDEDKTFETTVMICLEALGVLDQLKEATEKFKVEIQHELLEVIDSVSRRIIDEGDVDIEENEQDGDITETDSVIESGRPLARLIACLGEEFRACSSRNKRLLQLWKAALQKYKVPDSCLHTEQNYWSAVQQVLQLLLTEYLEIESVNLAAQRSVVTTECATELRISDYFAKKRPQRRKPKLFKLTAPMPTSPSTTARRHRYPLVCRAQPEHLYAVLPTLHALCAEVAPNSGGDCSLRAFITDYVRTGESERLAASARAQIDECCKANNAWRERLPYAVKGTNEHRIIFTCCATAWQAVNNTALAAKRCGACGGTEALRAVSASLAALAAKCSAAYSKISPNMASGSSMPSRAARWLADDDIVRFLQSLPNWRAVINPNSGDDNQQELNQAYEREAEILGSSLGDGAVTGKEIIADINLLTDLAVFCESMAWISANVKSLPTLVSGHGGLRLPEKFSSDISAASAIFEDLSNKCLLFLHLETRIQCFYYLGQEDRGDDNDAGGAGGLAHALLAFHENAASVLAEQRRAYILNGLGEMMSAGVVWRWQGEASSANDAGSRLATLRHCLAALQLPNVGLHRAHAYLKLLACEPEEIIASVREKGAQFTELEYLNAFKVIGARRGISAADMRSHLKQLSTALGHVGVTV